MPQTATLGPPTLFTDLLRLPQGGVPESHKEAWQDRTRPPVAPQAGNVGAGAEPCGWRPVLRLRPPRPSPPWSEVCKAAQGLRRAASSVLPGQLHGDELHDRWPGEEGGPLAWLFGISIWRGWPSRTHREPQLGHPNQGSGTPTTTLPKQLPHEEHPTTHILQQAGSPPGHTSVLVKGPRSAPPPTPASEDSWQG